MMNDDDDDYDDDGGVGGLKIKQTRDSRVMMQCSSFIIL
jgi:hypothetical protein